MQVIKDQLEKREKREAERKDHDNEHIQRLLNQQSNNKNGERDLEFEEFVEWQSKRREKDLEEVLKVKKEIEEMNKA